MAQINLLPWREKLRKQRQQEFGVMVVAGILFAAGIVVAWHFYNQSLIDFQNKRNKFLEQEIAILDKKIEEIKALEKKRAQLIARMNVIQNLQGSRPEAVRLFDELVETLPDGTYLTSFKQSGKGLSLAGRAQSNARVSSYMRNIEASQWIGRPKLGVIQSGKAAQGLRSFSMKASQVSPKKSQEGEEE